MGRYKGKELAGYRLTEKLGQGGMGAVYKGEAEGKPDAAIKVLYPQYSDDPDYVARFRRETTLTSELSHPNVVYLLDFGEDEELGCYQVFELIDGPNLRQHLEKNKLEMKAAVTLICQLLEGLAVAHERGIIHRDIKPENLLIDGDKVVISDFGVAAAPGHTTLTRTGFIPGTPEYMSPEQLGSKELTPASDLYSVGIVLYELLTGQTPFACENVAEIIQRQVYQLPHPPSYRNLEVPKSLDEVVLKALEKRPEDRYQSAASMLQALQGVELTAAAPPAAAVQPEAPPVAAAAPPVLEPTVMVETPQRARQLPLVWWLLPLLLLLVGWWRGEVALASHSRPPQWLEQADGIGPAPLTSGLAWAAKLHGAEVVITGDTANYSGRDRAVLLARHLGRLRASGADPERVQIAKKDKSWRLLYENTLLAEVGPEEALNRWQRPPKTVVLYWQALLRDHLSLAQGVEPRYTLRHERSYPLRTDEHPPLSPLFKLVYTRARHRVGEGPLDTATLLEAIASLGVDEREDFKQGARSVPIEVPEK